MKNRITTYAIVALLLILAGWLGYQELFAPLVDNEVDCILAKGVWGLNNCWIL